MSVHLADRSRPSRRFAVAPAPIRFDLSLSENPFPPLPSVRGAIQREIGQANRYPEFLPTRLPAVIAGRLGVRPDQVVVGSGATGVAMQILQTLTEPGSDMVLGVPTFDGYPIMAGMAGVEVIGLPSIPRANKTCPPSPAPSLPGRGWWCCAARTIRPEPLSPNAIYAAFSAPSPPTSRSSSTRRTPNSCPSPSASIHFLLSRHPNLLILRTFSKAYGLAGLRIGYALGHPDLITRVRRLQLPFGTPTLTLTAVTASYAAEPELAVRVARITEERDSSAKHCDAPAYPYPQLRQLPLPPRPRSRDRPPPRAYRRQGVPGWKRTNRRGRCGSRPCRPGSSSCPVAGRISLSELPAVMTMASRTRSRIR